MHPGFSVVLLLLLLRLLLCGASPLLSPLPALLLLARLPLLFSLLEALAALGPPLSHLEVTGGAAATPGPLHQHQNPFAVPGASPLLSPFSPLLP